MPSFEEIMKMPGTELKAEPALPVGTYHVLIDGPPANGKSSQKGTDFLRFRFKILSPYKDVDPMLAAEQQVVGKTINEPFYIKEGITWRIIEMLTNCGIDENLSLYEMVAEAPGKQLLLTLKHETSQDGKRVFHRVASTAHV